MSQLIIGPYRYNVLKQDGQKLLLSWIDSSTGIEKELWVNLSKLQGVLK